MSYADIQTYFAHYRRRGDFVRYRLFHIYGGESMTERQECFMCKQMYFPDDPEFDAQKRICDNCAAELELDNPYNVTAYNGGDYDDNE